MSRMPADASPPRASLAERVGAAFGVDSGWERVPADPVRIARNDRLVALGVTLSAIVGIELLRSFDALGPLPGPVWLPHAVAASGTALLTWRRRWPLVIAAILSLHMLVVGLTMPAVMASAPMQVTYFFALFTGVAWARDRRAMLLVVGGVIFVMFAWIALQFAVGRGVEELLQGSKQPLSRQGIVGPVVGYVLYVLLLNAFYFGGAVAGGQAAWRAALHRERLAEQAATIERQATELQEQAVVRERLRIARELHDVVAHHVSVIGIQAAAGRRVLTRDTDAAEGALRSIETSSRDAVTQMRGLLGTLRAGEDGGEDAGGRAPEPGLADVAQLVAASSSEDLLLAYSVVEDVPGALDSVPPPVGLSLYRTVQEALANVRRHSTAQEAQVFVRVVRRGESPFPNGYVEVEVLDAGRPRAGTSGSGLGLLGIRERLATHGGVSEIGPRVTGGYRVRVRMPLSSVTS